MRSRFVVVVSLSLVALTTGQASNQLTETPHLDQTVAEIRRQVSHFGDRPSAFCREFVLTTALMNRVQSQVSPLNYSLLSQSGKPLPKSPEECLALRAGICGTQVATFLELAQRLDLKARPVEFYLKGVTPGENHSHIGVEVHYAGQWRFVDVTWGTVYRRPKTRIDALLSIEQLLNDRDPGRLAVTNETDLWYQQWKAAGHDPLDYLKPKGRDVLIGRSGTIHLRPSRVSNGETIYRPTHQPNFVGRTVGSAPKGRVDVRLIDVPDGAGTVTIEVLGRAGQGQLEFGFTDEAAAKIPFDKLEAGPVRIELPESKRRDEIRIRVSPQPGNGIGYVVFKQITVNSTP